MGETSWLEKAKVNPNVRAWYKQLQDNYPQEFSNVPMESFLINDPSGYDYKKAVDANLYPVPQPADQNRFHWDDIGKTPKYYRKNMLPQNSMDMTKQFEGFVPTIYMDTKGNPTVGSGLNLKDKMVRGLVPADVISGKRPITPQENDIAVNAMYDNAVMVAREYAGNAWYNMTPEQRASIVDMAYNLGSAKLGDFKAMRKAIQRSDWNGVADEMVNSDWYDQVGRRSKYHEKQFRQSPRVKALKRR